MQFLIGMLLILALSLAPAPAPKDSGTTGKITVQAGTDGTQVGWELKTDGNPSVTIGGESDIFGN